MTYHQEVLTLERTILLDSLLILSFVCISKYWKCLKTKLIGFQDNNSNNAVGKADSTLIGDQN